MTLVRPVEISTGSQLVIEDSHIEIPLERLIFSSEPGFALSDDSRMTVVNSTISVRKDPRLIGALFDPYEWEVSIPAAWRVVNLVDGGESVQPFNPVLEYSVLMTEGEGFVVAAAQEAPDDDLMPLSVVGPDDAEPMEWIDVSVSLADYIGSTPRVTVFIHDAIARDVLISGLRITDDGEPISGDIEMTGVPDREGWNIGHMERFTDVFREHDWWINPLMEGSGDLVVSDSAIQASPGLDRKWNDYRPHSVGKEGQGPYATLQSAPFTGSLNLTGDLTVEQSIISYVPISVWGGGVSITGSTFVGDCELVSIGCSEGSDVRVRGSEFIYSEPKANQKRYSIDDVTWLLAVERGNAQAIIEDCTFTGDGAGIGIHVNMGEPVLRDCTFSELLVSLWVHEAVPSMRWDSLDATLAFDDSSQVHYLETLEFTVDYEGENEPPPSVNHSLAWYAYYPYYIDEMPDIYLMRHPTPNFLQITVPVFIAGPLFGEKVVKSMELSIDTRWAGYVFVKIDPSTKWMTVELNDDWSEEDGHWAYVSAFNDVGPTSGILSQRIKLKIEHEYYLSSYLNVTLDGEVVYTLDLVGLGHNMTTYRGDLYFNHTIPPGPHNLTYHVMGTYIHEDNIVELAASPYLVYRVVGQPEDDVLAWVMTRYQPGIIMVDEGVSVCDLAYAPDATMVDIMLDILTWNDSEIVIERLDFKTFGYGYFSDLNVVGNGTVVIEELIAGYLDSTIRNCTLVIGRIDTLHFYATVWNADLTIEAGRIFGLSFGVYDDSNLIFKNLMCSLDYGFGIYGIDSALLLKDCSFNGSGSATVKITGGSDSDVEVNNCSFNQLTLDIHLNEGTHSLIVTGCIFKGSRAFLFVLPNDDYADKDSDLLGSIPVEGSIDGNSFDGQGAGLIIFPPYSQVLLGENMFIGNAKTYAFFRPNVTIQGDIYNTRVVATLERFEIESNRWIDYTDYVPGWLNYLVDVTNNLASMDDPGLVDVLILETYSESSVRGRILAFERIRIADPRSSVPFLDWNYIGNDIRNMLIKYDIKDDHWDGWF
jgi:hypothetical protein